MPVKCEYNTSVRGRGAITQRHFARGSLRRQFFFKTLGTWTTINQIWDFEMREIEYRENLLSSDGGVELQEIVDPLAAFEKVDETLYWHTRASKTGCSAHALGSNPDGFVKPASLFRSHT